MLPAPSLNPIPRPNQPPIDDSAFLTPYTFRPRDGRVSTYRDFSDVHRSIALRMSNYITCPRSNYVRPRGAWTADLSSDHAYLLPAHNMEARIAFLRHALRVMRRHRAWYRAPLCFVTIAPRRFVLPFDDAAAVDLHSLRAVTRQALAGLPYIGMVDFALLKSWGDERVPELDNTVSVHTHGLVPWHGRDAVVEACRAMGGDFKDLKGRFAANVKEIKPEWLEGYLCYLMKAPLRYSRVRRGNRYHFDEDAGELVREPCLKKFPLRGGDQLRMAAVLREIYLDELLFGQGAGTAVAREIRNESLAPLRRHNKGLRARGTDRHRLVPIGLNIPPSSRCSASVALSMPFNLFRRFRLSGGRRGVDPRVYADPRYAWINEELADL